MLERLPAMAPQQWSSTAQLLAEGPLANAQSIGLLAIGQIKPQELEQLSTALRASLGNREVVISNDLLVTRNVSSQLLVTAAGVAQRRTLQQLREQLALQGTPVAGWLLIDSENLDR